MKKVNPSLLLFFIFFIGLIPCAASILYYFDEQEHLEDSAFLIERKEKALELFCSKQSANILAHRRFLHANSKYLEKNLNNLSFNTILGDKHSYFTESFHELKNPQTSVDTKEIERILVLVENPDAQENPPQLLINTFEIERIPSFDEQDKFKLNLKILQRDFSL